MTNPEELNEAPASATLSVITPAGYNTLFTVRDTEVSELVKKIAKLEEVFVQLGYKPQPAKQFGQKVEKDYVQGRVCPKDGGKLVNKVSKAGKKYIACENGKYDPNTKTTIGCNYVEWPEDSK
jgi:hypothetical protein